MSDISEHIREQDEDEEEGESNPQKWQQMHTVKEFGSKIEPSEDEKSNMNFYLRNNTNVKDLHR